VEREPSLPCEVVLWVLAPTSRGVSGESLLQLSVNTDGCRIPALWNGIYGLKPSVARLPHTGLQGPHDGMDALVGCVGPLGSSIDDLELFCSSILSQNPWHMEAQTINKPWIHVPHEPARKLKIAVMYDDGLCAPHPPITAALDNTVTKLRLAGHDIVPWIPIRPLESEQFLFTVCLQDGGAEYYEHLALSGEPPIPMIDWLLRTKAPKPFTSPRDLWPWVTKREVLRQQSVEQWTNAGGIDVILCPGAPTLAPRKDRSRHWGYTSMWNVLDWPAVTFPVERAAVGQSSWPPHSPRNDVERFVFDEWKEEWYEGAPVGLQVVGRRLEEEKLLADLRIIEGVLKGT
jgi:amidase